MTDALRHEIDTAFLSGRAAGRADSATEVQRLQSELDGVHEALDLASQQRSGIVAVLGLEQGEDELAALSELASLRAEVVKSLGFGAEQNFARALNRHVDEEVERRAGRIDAARLRTTADLSRATVELREAQKAHQRTISDVSDLRAAHQRTIDAVRAALELPPDADLSIAANNLVRELKSLRAEARAHDAARRALRVILDVMERPPTPTPTPTTPTPTPTTPSGGRS